MTSTAADDPGARESTAERARESTLVERAKAGDAAAFGDLVVLHQDVAFRVAYLALGSAADAEDVAQEAFVKAYLALDRFRPDAPFRPWLLRIVGNEARNRLRTTGRRASLLERAATALQVGTARSADLAAASAERIVLADEAWEDVRDALHRLRPEERRVVVHRYLLELSEAETAAALDVPAGTVKSRLSRGLARLRAQLDETEPQDPGVGTA